MHFNLVILYLFVVFATQAKAEIKVVTTTANVAALINEIGGPHVDVTSLTKGSQDPHYVEAKPSYMMLVSKADLLVSIGLDLEIGWLPAILNGARNSNIMPGGKGSVILGDFVEPLEKIGGHISREHGDVHPLGNPHFMLDPIRAASLSKIVANKLAELDAENSQFYKTRAQKFAANLEKMTIIWKAAVAKSGIKEIFTYHKTLNYFLERMGVRSVGYMEPKPGVPPTPSHILGLIKKANKEGIQLTLVENYFETSAADRVARDVKGMQVQAVPVSVAGSEGIKDLRVLYEALVAAVIHKPSRK